MRGWIVFPFGANPWWICLASVVPAILVTILIFMDQQITAVILNRKEYKLQVSRAQGWRGAGRVLAAHREHCSTLCVSSGLSQDEQAGKSWHWQCQHLGVLAPVEAQPLPGRRQWDLLCWGCQPSHQLWGCP